jgi:hypothetical protein
MHTQPNRPHQNKRNDQLLQIVWIRWQNTLNTRFYHSNGVSVPTEDE